MRKLLQKLFQQPLFRTFPSNLLVKLLGHPASVKGHNPLEMLQQCKHQKNQNLRKQNLISLHFKKLLVPHQPVQTRRKRNQLLSINLTKEECLKWSPKVVILFYQCCSIALQQRGSILCQPILFQFLNFFILFSFFVSSFFCIVCNFTFKYLFVCFSLEYVLVRTQHLICLGGSSVLSVFQLCYKYFSSVLKSMYIIQFIVDIRVNVWRVKKLNFKLKKIECV